MQVLQPQEPVGGAQGGGGLAGGVGGLGDVAADQQRELRHEDDVADRRPPVDRQVRGEQQGGDVAGGERQPADRGDAAPRAPRRRAATSDTSRHSSSDALVEPVGGVEHPQLHRRGRA